MSRCPACGAELSGFGAFCASCGTPLGEAADREIESEPSEQPGGTTGDGRETHSSRRKRSLALSIALAVGLGGLAALAAFLAFGRGAGSARARVTDPQTLATCLARSGAVFQRFGESPDLTTLAVDLDGSGPEAPGVDPGLYVYVAASDDVSRGVLRRLRQIAPETGVLVRDSGRVLLAYVSKPTDEEEMVVEGCLR